MISRVGCWRWAELRDQRKRLETSFMHEEGDALRLGAWRKRVLQWLRGEALPVWAGTGVDRTHGGYFEALSLQGRPVMKPKRVRTIARQVYAFAVATERGWSEAAPGAMAHGMDFLQSRGRSSAGGWVRVLDPDGTVADGAEDAYDTACVLLALAHAYRCGDARALPLASETLTFLDQHLLDHGCGGYRETSRGGVPRRSNPHMHLMEAFLAWYDATGDQCYLERAGSVAALFKRYFFDADNWAVREFFTEDWQPAPGEAGEWTEPGHQFEWAALLVAFATRSGETEWFPLARKIYSSAVASGLSRTTGLAFGAVDRTGRPIEAMSRSWQQAEAVKAVIALDQTGGPDMKPEIEARLALLFRWHIASAVPGLWIDRVDERGRSCSTEVPASILYHLVNAFALYLDYTTHDGSAARRPSGGILFPKNALHVSGHERVGAKSSAATSQSGMNGALAGPVPET